MATNIFRGGQVKYESESWNLKDGSGNPYPWLNNIQFTFWSYAPKGGDYYKFDFGLKGSRKIIHINDFVNPSKAEDQKDVIVAYNNRWYNNGNKNDYIDIKFRHALAVVNFNVAAITDYTVTKIEIIGAYNKGKCDIDGEDLDDDDVTAAFAWNLDKTSTDTFVMTGANDNFFMLPQTLPSDAQIRITLEKGGVKTRLDTKPLRTTWLPGKSYRYVLKYTDSGISVEVVEDFSENVKTDVGAKNTSTSQPAYVRMAIIANWIDSEGDIVEPCDFVTEGELEGYLGTNWVENNGFYYYKKGIRPNAETKNKLFTSYKAPAPPEAGLDLEMTVIAQAIEYDITKAEAAWNISGILIGTVEE